MLEQDRQGLADKTASEPHLLLLPKLTHLTGACVNDRLRHFILELRRRGAGTHGVGKHVKVGEGAGLKKRQAAGELGFPLARKANDEIRAKRRVWQGLAQSSQHIARERSIIAPAHA